MNIETLARELHEWPSFADGEDLPVLPTLVGWCLQDDQWCVYQVGGVIITEAQWQAKRDELVLIKAVESLKVTSDESKYPAWITWEGGECPVDGDSEVVTRLRNGSEVTGKAHTFYWPHYGNDFPGEIIAYRPNYPEFLVNPFKGDEPVEEWLPPSGTHCLYCPDPNSSPDEWHKCVFIGRVNGEDFVDAKEEPLGVDRVKAISPDQRFRPIKSEKEIQVEKIKEILVNQGEMSDFYKVVVLYDAGCRVPSESDS